MHDSRFADPLGRRHPLEWLGPALLALALAILNDLSSVAGWLRPPRGFIPLGIADMEDVAQYVTWARAAQNAWLLPNYHAPWISEPALFSAFGILIGRADLATGLGIIPSIKLFHWISYLLAAYALWFCLRAFTQGMRQAAAALLVAVCVVPLSSFWIIPWILGHGTGYLPGSRYFVSTTSDGLFHGIMASPLVTFGTAGALTIMGLLARFWTTRRRGYFYAASGATLFFGILHPYEIVATTAAGVMALVLSPDQVWRTRLRLITLLAGASAIGLIPHIMLMRFHPWLASIATGHHWRPGSPVILLAAVGLPAIFALGFIWLRTDPPLATDRQLKLWFAAPLILAYLPIATGGQHLLDGFHYATAILVVRLAGRLELRFPALRRRALAAVIACLILALAAHALYRVQSFREGGQPESEFAAVVPASQPSVINWLRSNAGRDDLILAPAKSAFWMATVPMHSLASHWLFSATFVPQLRFSEAFYQHQQLIRSELDCYGVRYILVPKSNPPLVGIVSALAVNRASFDDVILYEIPGNVMMPYPGRPCAKEMAVSLAGLGK